MKGKFPEFFSPGKPLSKVSFAPDELIITQALQTPLMIFYVLQRASSVWTNAVGDG